MKTKNPPIRKNSGIQSYASELMPSNPEDLIILRKRAEHFAKREVKAAEVTEGITYIRFRLGNDYYGIPYQFANEVIQKANITKIPLVPDFISGVINWRGLLLPVLNLQLYFNINNQKDTSYANTSIIIVIGQKISLGILVDDIIGNDSYDPTTLDAPLYSDNAIKPDYVLGLHKGMTAILNVENIFSDIKLLKLNKENSIRR